MSRAVRITVGAVVAGVLAFVAVVAGAMSVGPGVGGGFLDDLGTEGLDSRASAEVLDVDDDYDWPTVDVRWTTPDGEVVVTYVDWEWTPDLPEVGATVDVVYDPYDPEYAFAADDPWVAEGGGAAGGPVDGAAPPVDDDGVGEVAGWVALAALLGLLVTAVVTVVAAVRAPAPRPGPHQPGPHQPGPYEAPHPGMVAVGAPPPQYPPVQYAPPQYPPLQYAPPQPHVPGGPSGEQWSNPG